MSTIKSLSAAAIILVLMTTLAQAKARPFGIHGIGPRLGATIDPDQFHFGGHLDLGDLAPRLMMFPNVEVGLGNNWTIVTTAFELDYRFREDWGSWNPYLGGGIGPVFFSWDDNFRDGDGRGGSNSNTELGIYFQGGIARQLGGRSGFFFLEMKLGLSDAPDIKFTTGWNFGT